MSTVKVIEVMAASRRYWNGPVQRATEEADKSLHNIRSVWMKSLDGEELKGKVKSWKLTCTVSFEVEDEEDEQEITSRKKGIKKQHRGLKRILSLF